MFKHFLFYVAVALGIFLCGQALAHTPLCSCYDNGDDTITCEGGFSDGSSASGVQVRVEDAGGGVLIKGKMDEDGEFTFDKPSEDYNVVFDAGEGHVIKIVGKEIVE
ncbi:MAG: hypothetical protein PVI90_16505 [Desulfobacteraceae bacterium]|jgi:hypothetical protein